MLVPRVSSDAGALPTPTFPSPFSPTPLLQESAFARLIVPSKPPSDFRAGSSRPQDSRMRCVGLIIPISQLRR